KRLVAIAEIGDGDPVKTLLDVCNGDVEQVQAYVETLHDITQSIFRRWLIAVRLDYLENKGGTR
ncbi:MAG: hypothetical protein Q7U97_17655, partial [Rhodocyclaceae bacterium]|nr:hypothetical protein [Rhodocyclaceae bacterium]